MFQEIIEWAMLIIPIISLFFLQKGAFRKYLSVSLFVTIINSIMYLAPWHYN
ncbi:hypothetical protein [Niallia nealsonii]|uniref:hypothetical protein n=1 Tax=Niallia nealsonii TaxID=115979 RepID=UPI0012FF20B3|nr:hypothetical protein [Niallia nealsonii]